MTVRRVLSVLLPVVFLFVSIGCQSTGSASGSGTPIWAVDFESVGERHRYSQHPLLDVMDEEGVGGSYAVRATYDGFPRGSRRIAYRIAFPEKMMEATLNFDVRFGEHFQFVRGGKLHGLGPARAITGGKPMKPAGWSARIMFLADGRIGTYSYVQNKSSKYGVSGRDVNSFRFQRNRFYSVSLHVRLNDPVDRENGFSRLYVDGEPVMVHEQLQFRAKEGDRSRIQKMLFSTFHGGHQPKHAPTTPEGDFTTVYAYFDNFAIHRGRHIRGRDGESGGRR